MGSPTGKSGAAKRKARRRKQWTPPKVRKSPITVSRRLPVISLGANYGVVEDGASGIHGRTPEAQAEKDRFQRDAMRYVRALGQALAVHGKFTEQRVTRNRGREHDAGCVMATFYHPGLSYWLSLYIQSAPDKTAIPRPDGVIILACRRSYQPSREEERMHYLNPAMSSLQLALVLLVLAGVRPAGDLNDPGASGADFHPQSLFDGPTVAPVQTGGGQPEAVRVWLLGDYRRCRLLKPGQTAVEVACIDPHPRVALAYWGKRITRSINSVHPNDRLLCLPPDQG